MKVMGFIMGSLLIPAFVIAQEEIIIKVADDSTGHAIANAVAKIAGTTTEVSANARGLLQLVANIENDSIIIAAPDYESKTVKIPGNTFTVKLTSLPGKATDEQYKGNLSYAEYPDIPLKVDVSAVYPGGLEAMSKFVKRNLHYPSGTLRIKGRVFVGFIVERNGFVTNVKVINSVHPKLDAEAIRVVKLFPPWTPALLDGRAVRSRFVLPVVFGGLKSGNQSK